jgi:hypothetical protein
VLNAEGVDAGAGLPLWSLNCQIPITGKSLVSVGWPVSSMAVTETDAVRFACAVNSNQSALL